MELALGLLRALIALYGVIFIGAAYFAPDWYLANAAKMPDPDRERTLKKWLIYSHYFIAMFGIGIVFYYGSLSVVGFIPENWGIANEDGEWSSFRSAIQGFIALCGAVGLATAADNRAKSALYYFTESQMNWAILEAFNNKYHNSADDVRRDVSVAARRILKENYKDGISLRSFKLEKARLVRALVDAEPGAHPSYYVKPRGDNP